MASPYLAATMYPSGRMVSYPPGAYPSHLPVYTLAPRGDGIYNLVPSGRVLPAPNPHQPVLAYATQTVPNEAEAAAVKRLEHIQNHPIMRSLTFYTFDKIYKRILTHPYKAHLHFQIHGGSNYKLLTEIYSRTEASIESDVDSFVYIDPSLPDANFTSARNNLISIILGEFLKIQNNRRFQEPIQRIIRMYKLSLNKSLPTLLEDGFVSEDKPISDWIKQYGKPTDSPLMITFLSGDFEYNLIRLSLRTLPPIDLFEVTVPRKNYPNLEFFWKTYNEIGMSESLHPSMGDNVTHLRLQPPVQAMYNQIYSAKRARTDENRVKRTRRAKNIRNSIVGTRKAEFLPNMRTFERTDPALFPADVTQNDFFRFVSGR